MIVGAKFITSAANLSQSPNFAVSEVAFLGRSNVGKSSLINALTRQKNLAKSSSTPGKTKLINFFEVSFKGAEFKANFVDKNAPNAKFQSQNSQNLSSNQNDESQNALNLPRDENAPKNAELKEKFAPQNAQSKQNDNERKNAEFNDKFTLIFVDLPGFGYAKVSHAQRAQWDKNLDEFLRGRTAIRLFVHLIDARHENLASDESISEYLQSLLTPSQKILKVFTKADKLNQSQKTRLKNAFGNALLVSSATKQGLDALESEIIAQSLGL